MTMHISLFTYVLSYSAVQVQGLQALISIGVSDIQLFPKIA